jgi:hypothetical protein
MDLLNAFIVPFLGALIGTGLAFLILERRRGAAQRRAQQQAIENLIDDLHFRRAFAPDIPERADPAASGVVDQLALVLRSVMKARDAVREARDQLIPGSPAFGSIRKMMAALNIYLERQQIDPARYRFFLQECRQQLNGGIDELLELTGITPRYAGEGAYAGFQPAEEAEPLG